MLWDDVAQTHANLGWVWEGEGGIKIGDPVIGGNLVIGETRLNPTPIKIRSLKCTPIWDGTGMW